MQHLFSCAALTFVMVLSELSLLPLQCMFDR